MKDEYLIPPTEKNTPLQGGVVSIGERDYPLKDRDVAMIMATYEQETVNYNTEEAALATHYKDVYSTHSFSQRVREQMNYYPGLHQEGSVSETNPFVTNAERQAKNRLSEWDNALNSPDSFMGALRDNQQDIDYESIFGTNKSAKERAQGIGKVLTECIPCFDRLLDLNGLVPDGDLLEVHLLNIQLRTDILDKILGLFRDPGMYVDICELLKLLSGLCPQDLLALLALLTQYLAKLNLDFKFNLDFILNLVGPILSPFLDALSQWLDKWMQLILAPILCVTDHINEVIYLLNTTALAARDASVSVDGEFNLNILGQSPNFLVDEEDKDNYGTGIGFKNMSSASAQGNTWTEGEILRYDTPEDTRYKQYKPEFPLEDYTTTEQKLSSEEMLYGWNDSLGVGPATPTEQKEAEERKKKIEDTKKRQFEQSKALKKLPGADRYKPSDGTRWSEDNIPLSDKESIASYATGSTAHPPEEQAKPFQGIEYFDPSPLVNSIVQLRNIVQSAIKYVQDWFNYAVQMIYDLLGVDFGWLLKKGDTSFLKSRIIQLINMIRSIISSIAKNGLKCGVNSNFDLPQLKYILENNLNSISTTKFSVNDDGDITVLPPSGSLPSIQDLSKKTADLVKKKEDPTFGDTSSVQEKAEQEVQQKSRESGIIIKNCLKDMTQTEINQARQWIAAYERGMTNG